MLVNVELADERVVGRGDLFLPIDDGLLRRTGAELTLHVGLTAADPNFSDKDVFEFDRR